MSSDKKPTITVPTSTKSQIEEILTGFLKDCDITYPRGIQVDPSFRDACYAEATRRGFDLKIGARHLETGIAIADTAYRHLDNHSTRVFIAVWTGLVTHMDDMFEVYVDGLNEFFDRFTRREPQRYQVLDQLVTMTYEFPHHWGVIPSNLIVASEIDFLTSTIMDRAVKGMEIQPSMAPEFPDFKRRISGLSRAFGIMTFPPHLDLKTWIQVTPDLIRYSDYANDLLSFYKEELEGETVNYISMIANSNGVTKIEALQRLVHETVQCVQRGYRLLQSDPVALEAYRGFIVGYVEFHALAARYKLDQLNL